MAKNMEMAWKLPLRVEGLARRPSLRKGGLHPSMLCSIGEAVVVHINRCGRTHSLLFWQNLNPKSM